MAEDQESLPTISEYRVMVSDTLYSFTSEFPEVLQDYVSRLRPHLENFCFGNKDVRVESIDFSHLTYASVQLFYRTLNDNLPKGSSVGTYVHLFGRNVTLNYVLLPTSTSATYAVLLVCDNVPSTVIEDPEVFLKFALFRNIHEGSINTLH